MARGKARNVNWRPTDQFGRILAYVYTADGISIDEVLIRKGWLRPGRETASTGTFW